MVVNVKFLKKGVLIWILYLFLVYICNQQTRIEKMTKIMQNMCCMMCQRGAQIHIA